MNKKNLKKVKWLGSSIILIVIATVYWLHPYSSDNVGESQGDLISASGILAGILIAFLSTRLFQQADERNKARIILNEYADRLTLFRKLLSHVIKSSEFWKFKHDITIFRKEAPNANWHDLHGDGDQNMELRQKFWLDNPEKKIHHTTVDLYLAMEEVIGKTENDYWLYNSQLFEYDLEYLLRAEMPANQIWYYLEGRYEKHTVGQVEEIKGYYELSQLNPLVRSIAPRYNNQDFSRETLGNIGSYFQSEILPEMIELTYKLEQRFTRTIIRLFSSLTIVLVFGVIIPLIMRILDLGETEKLTTTTCVTVVIISLFIFLVDLIEFAINDDEKSILDKERTMIRASQD